MSGVLGWTTMIILVPVSVWKQCRSKVSASSSSMPVQPCAGDSCAAIACRECLEDIAKELILRFEQVVAALKSHHWHGALRQVMCGGGSSSLEERIHHMLARRRVSFRLLLDIWTNSWQ